MTNATTKDKIVQHGSEEINALLGDREDKLNSVTNEANSPEEETSNSNEKSGTGMVFVCIDLLDLYILHVVIIFQIKIFRGITRTK